MRRRRHLGLTGRRLAGRARVTLTDVEDASRKALRMRRGYHASYWVRRRQQLVHCNRAIKLFAAAATCAACSLVRIATALPRCLKDTLLGAQTTLWHWFGVQTLDTLSQSESDDKGAAYTYCSR